MVMEAKNHESDAIRGPPPLLDNISHGASIPAHDGHSLDSPPPWLDLKQYRRGQEFAQKYLTPVLIGNFFTMMNIFVWQPIFQVVLYTGNLETICKSAKRNFTTLFYVKSWYEGDLWNPSDKSYQNMRKVQLLHISAAVSTNQKKNEVEVLTANTGLEKHIEEQCCFWKSIREGLARDGTYQPRTDSLQVPRDHCYISQLDHVITVLSIISPVILAPQKLGIHGASKEDLEAYVYMWRVLSYHLGIQDQFNPCSGGLYLTQARCQELLDAVAYPALKNISKEQEYIMRVTVYSMMKTIQLTKFLSFEVMLMFMAWCMNDVDVSVFYSLSTWHAKLRFWVLRFIAYYVIRVPFVLSFLNDFMRVQTAKYSSGMEKMK